MNEKEVVLKVNKLFDDVEDFNKDLLRRNMNRFNYNNDGRISREVLRIIEESYFEEVKLELMRSSRRLSEKIIDDIRMIFRKSEKDPKLANKLISELLYEATAQSRVNLEDIEFATRRSVLNKVDLNADLDFLSDIRRNSESICEEYYDNMNVFVKRSFDFEIEVAKKKEFMTKNSMGPFDDTVFLNEVFSIIPEIDGDFLAEKEKLEILAVEKYKDAIYCNIGSEEYYNICADQYRKEIAYIGNKFIENCYYPVLEAADKLSPIKRFEVGENKKKIMSIFSKKCESIISKTELDIYEKYHKDNEESSSFEPSKNLPQDTKYRTMISQIKEILPNLTEEDVNEFGAKFLSIRSAIAVEMKELLETKSIFENDSVDINDLDIFKKYESMVKNFGADFINKLFLNKEFVFLDDKSPDELYDIEAKTANLYKVFDDNVENFKIKYSKIIEKRKLFYKENNITQINNEQKQEEENKKEEFLDFTDEKESLFIDTPPAAFEEEVHTLYSEEESSLNNIPTKTSELEENLIFLASEPNTGDYFLDANTLEKKEKEDKLTDFVLVGKPVLHDYEPEDIKEEKVEKEESKTTYVNKHKLELFRIFSKMPYLMKVISEESLNKYADEYIAIKETFLKNLMDFYEDKENFKGELVNFVELEFFNDVNIALKNFANDIVQTEYVDVQCQMVKSGEIENTKENFEAIKNNSYDAISKFDENVDSILQNAEQFLVSTDTLNRHNASDAFVK
ncbi:MAG: hypothetical protein R3Y13_01910 [bacterium]